MLNLRRWRQLAEWRVRARRDDAAVQELLARVLTPTSNCVDVGAHEGEFLGYFLDRAPQGEHVAIEALPDLAERLRRQYPSVRVVQCAVAATDGQATFYHAVDRPAWSGLAKQNVPGETTVVEFATDLKPLDGLVSDTSSVDFVKIDVEGAELGVLSGATEILSHRRATVLFEHALIHSKPHDTDSGQVFDALDDAGYSISSLSGVGPHSRAEFISLCLAGERSGYGWRAQTNWVASPKA